MNKKTKSANKIIKLESKLICKDSVNEEYKYFPKIHFIEIERELRKTQLLKSESPYNNFKRIFENLEIIAKLMGRICKGAKEFIKMIKKQILTESNFKDKDDKNVVDFSKNNIKNNSLEVANSLKLHNFSMSGKLLAKLFNNIGLQSTE